MCFIRFGFLSASSDTSLQKEWSESGKEFVKSLSDRAVQKVRTLLESAPEMRIELKEVTKSYGRMCALDKVSLTIEPGQIVAVLGPNGAGKSTLLRCLAGIAA